MPSRSRRATPWWFRGAMWRAFMSCRQLSRRHCGKWSGTSARPDQRFGVDAFNIGVNDGLAAGQTISHAHIHVIPRRPGDVKDPRGGVRWVIAEKAAYWGNRLDEPSEPSHEFQVHF